MKTIILIALAACTLFFSTGCATILKGTNESLLVTSDPSGARVQINGIDVGNTPISTRVNGTKDQFVQVRKDGYETRTASIASTVGAGWIILDFLCGGLPLVVDAITGDWKSLERNDAHVVLDKK
jgi:hypothetical protein